MSEVTVVVLDNGPYRVTGACILQDAEGNTFDVSDRPAVALCRCGQSSNKPFCDGTHREGFQSEVRAS